MRLVIHAVFRLGRGTTPHSQIHNDTSVSPGATPGQQTEKNVGQAQASTVQANFPPHRPPFFSMREQIRSAFVVCGCACPAAATSICHTPSGFKNKNKKPTRCREQGQNTAQQVECLLAEPGLAWPFFLSFFSFAFPLPCFCLLRRKQGVIRKNGLPSILLSLCLCLPSDEKSPRRSHFGEQLRAALPRKGIARPSSFPSCRTLITWDQRQRQGNIRPNKQTNGIFPHVLGFSITAAWHYGALACGKDAPILQITVVKLSHISRSESDSHPPRKAKYRAAQTTK